MKTIVKAQIKHLHVDEDDAYYCEACWNKSVCIRPLGEHEEFETVSESADMWCQFSLTHGSVYEM